MSKELVKHITKDVVLYQHYPRTKYQWTGLISLVTGGCCVLYTFAMPTQSQVDEARRKRSNENATDKPQSKKLEAPPQERTKTLRDEFVENNPQLAKELGEEISTISVRREPTRTEKVYHFFFKEVFVKENLSARLQENFWSTLIVILGMTAIMSGYMTFSQRNVHRIILQADRKLRIELFRPFYFIEGRTLTMPLRDISCLKSRYDDMNYCMLKHRGKTVPYMLHKSEGHFPDPKLYDEILGRRRAWHAI